MLLDLCRWKWSKLVSILDYEWVPIGIRKMLMLLIPRNFGIAGSIGVLALDAIIGGVIGVVVLAIKIAAIIKEVISIILEYARDSSFGEI